MIVSYKKKSLTTKMVWATMITLLKLELELKKLNSKSPEK